MACSPRDRLTSERRSRRRAYAASRAHDARGDRRRARNRDRDREITFASRARQARHPARPLEGDNGMNEPLSKDGRMALIGDATGAPLDQHEAEELALLADVLADPATWDEPRPELEDLVVDAVATATATVSPLPSVPAAQKARRRGLFSVAGIAAAAAVVVAAVGMGVLGSAAGN